MLPGSKFLVVVFACSILFGEVTSILELSIYSEILLILV